MKQIYTFTSEGVSMEKASSHVMEKVNHFLAQAQTTLTIDVAGMQQSESQSVSVWDGMNDWSYSFTITLVINVLPSEVEKIHQMYLSA